MENKPITHAPVPDFGQLVEYVTEAKPLERENDVFVGVFMNRIPITQHNLESQKVLEELKADYEHVELTCKRPVDLLSEQELNDLKKYYLLDSKLTAVHPVDAIDLLLRVVAAPVIDK